MTDRRSPEPGVLSIGPVSLPAGKLVNAVRERPRPGERYLREPVAWVTVNPVPNPGQVWAALSEAHQQTGLVPILLDGLENHDPRRPWDTEEFGNPPDPREADAVNVAELIQEWWSGSLPSKEDMADDEEVRQTWAPFHDRFPGLAPPAHGSLTLAEREWALRYKPLARIGLIPAARPADVLAAIGWPGVTNWGGLDGWDDFLIPLTAVLRSWEERFGARVFEVGFADLRLFVERPPRDLAAAEVIAAEQFQLADDCIDGCRDIPGIAARLVNSPFWTFWWD
jgi:hypothetical protein